MFCVFATAAAALAAAFLEAKLNTPFQHNGQPANPKFYQIHESNEITAKVTNSVRSNWICRIERRKKHNQENKGKKTVSNGIEMKARIQLSIFVNWYMCAYEQHVECHLSLWISWHVCVCVFEEQRERVSVWMNVCEHCIDCILVYMCGIGVRVYCH